MITSLQTSNIVGTQKPTLLFGTKQSDITKNNIKEMSAPINDKGLTNLDLNAVQKPAWPSGISPLVKGSEKLGAGMNWGAEGAKALGATAAGAVGGPVGMVIGLVGSLIGTGVKAFGAKKAAKKQNEENKKRYEEDLKNYNTNLANYKQGAASSLYAGLQNSGTLSNAGTMRSAKLGGKLLYHKN